MKKTQVKIKKKFFYKIAQSNIELITFEIENKRILG